MGILTGYYCISFKFNFEILFMKKIFQATVVSLIIINAGFAQTAGDYKKREVKEAKAANMSISINGGKLMLNKTLVSGDWKVKPLYKLFATTDRKRDGVNITHSYDDYGIVLFEKTNNQIPSGDLVEFQVYISTGDKNEVTPNLLYNGEIEIEKNKVYSFTSLEDLRDILKDYIEGTSYSDHSFRFSKDGLYMYVQYDDDDELIEKISIGKDTRKQ